MGHPGPVRGLLCRKSQGYYTAAGLDVDIRQGSAEITPEPVVASGQAEFGIDWLPSLLVAREQGMHLSNIAQIFQRSGTTELTWRDSGLSAFEHCAATPWPLVLWQSI